MDWIDEIWTTIDSALKDKRRQYHSIDHRLGLFWLYEAELQHVVWEALVAKLGFANVFKERDARYRIEGENTEHRGQCDLVVLGDGGTKGLWLEMKCLYQVWREGAIKSPFHRRHWGENFFHWWSEEHKIFPAIASDLYRWDEGINQWDDPREYELPVDATGLLLFTFWGPEPEVQRPEGTLLPAQMQIQQAYDPEGKYLLDECFRGRTSSPADDCFLEKEGSGCPLVRSEASMVWQPWDEGERKT